MKFTETFVADKNIAEFEKTYTKNGKEHPTKEQMNPMHLYLMLTSFF